MRKPASTIASSVDRSGPSACAPSIASMPAVRRGSVARAPRYAARSSRVPMSRNAPSDRAASRCARSARNRARAGRLRQVRGGQRGGDGHAGHVVAAVVVALDVEVARRLDRGREHLERDAALDHPRHVEMAAGPAHEQVAPEQQRVRVQVDGPDRGVEGAAHARTGAAAGP